MSYKKDSEIYCNRLSNLLLNIQATGNDKEQWDFSSAIEYVCKLSITQTAAGRKIIFIGNGASSSISSHMATDYWKNGGMRAMAFNDAALLTCISNDCGYENVFAKPLEMFADEGDILFAISSSGASENILNGVHAAKKMGVYVVTFSGFKPDNPLSAMGDVNFYVPYEDYGPVEVVHLSITHCILDVIMASKQQEGCQKK